MNKNNNINKLKIWCEYEILKLGLVKKKSRVKPNETQTIDLNIYSLYEVYFEKKKFHLTDYAFKNNFLHTYHFLGRS